MIEVKQNETRFTMFHTKPAAMIQELVEDEDLTSLVSSNRLSEMILQADNLNSYSTKPKDLIDYGSNFPLQTEEEERDDLDSEPVVVQLVGNEDEMESRAVDTQSSKALNPMMIDDASSCCEDSFSQELGNISLSARK
jgi:hypothetical protein